MVSTYDNKREKDNQSRPFKKNCKNSIVLYFQGGFFVVFHLYDRDRFQNHCRFSKLDILNHGRILTLISGVSKFERHIENPVKHIIWLGSECVSDFRDKSFILLCVLDVSSNFRA